MLWLELVDAALALGLLALYLSVLGKGLIPIVAAAVIVSFLVLVTLRPRPADAWPDSDPGHSASGREGDDERATRSAGPALIAGSRLIAQVRSWMTNALP